MPRGRNFLVTSIIFLFLSIPLFVFSSIMVCLILAILIAVIGVYLLFHYLRLKYLEKYGLEDLEELMTFKGYKGEMNAVITAWPPAISWAECKITFRIALPCQTQVIEFSSDSSINGEVNLRYVVFFYKDLAVIYDWFENGLLLYKK